MLKSKKLALLTGASALAMGLAMSQASAFNEVNWSWEKVVDENVTIDIDIDALLEPIGMVEVEKLQISFGHKNASAYLDYFENQQPQSFTTHELEFSGTASGPVELGVDGEAEGYVDIEWTPETGNDPNAETGFVGIIGQPEGTSITEGVNDPEGPDVVAGINGGENPLVVTGTASGDIELAVNGTAQFLVLDPIDAVTQLPSVEVSALALGNSESITSDVATYVHEGQFAFGDPNFESFPENGAWVEGDNTHTALAAESLSWVLGGLVGAADMTATATANTVYNAALDVSATSIANNHSIEIDAASADDAILIADLTQFAYANNVANATVNTHIVSNYANLGELENPITNVSAVAAGNISNISVSAFEVEVGDPAGGGGEAGD